jgi:hypothetical protein
MRSQGLKSWIAIGAVVLCSSAGLACGPVGGPARSAPGGPAPQQSDKEQDGGRAPQVLALPAAGLLYHGVLPAGTSEPDSDISQSNLDAYLQTVGRSVAYVYFSNDWYRARAFPVATASWIRDRGSIPFIRLMMRSQRQPLVTDPTFTLDRIIGGEFDVDLERWADAARAFGSPLIVEYGTEVNGDWNPWSAPYNGGLDVGPAKFKLAYRHIVTVMRSRGVTNVTWALHYNAQNFPEDPRNVPRAYYPGDDVVDWIGVSAYGSERPHDHRCPSLRRLIDDVLPQLRDATTTRPFFVFEFGITDNNPGCPAGPWVQAGLADLLGGRWPELRGFAWWNEHWQNDANPVDDSDMLVQDNAAVGQAFNHALTSSGMGKVADRPVVHGP